MDMRPGEPMRSTLRDWVQACGKCGAAAWDLSTLPAGTKAVVESAPYHALSLEAAEDTRLFRRWAMICVAAGDQEMAAETTLMAAWAADDGADMVEAAKLRRDVAALWGEPADLSKALRLLDVLRRAGEFAAVETLRAEAGGQWGDQWGNRRAGCVRCRGRRVPARPRRGPRRRPPPALERRGEPCASARSPNPEILERAAAAVAQAFPYYCRYYCHWSEADEAIPAERRTNRPDSAIASVASLLAITVVALVLCGNAT